MCLEYANYLATDEDSLDDVDCAACIRENVNHNKDTKQVVTVNRKLSDICQSNFNYKYNICKKKSIYKVNSPYKKYMYSLKKH